MAPAYWKILLYLLPAVSALSSRLEQPPNIRRAPQSSDSSGNSGSPTKDSSPPVSTDCGLVFDQVKQQTFVFKASEVYKCLISVPFHTAVALRFIKYFNTTIQFQSTLAYLRDPPEGYQQPAVDVQASLAAIKENVESGYYKNQYAFEVDVQRVVHAMHDNHVMLQTGVLEPFSFSAPDAISSVSLDGKEAPKIYFTRDIINAQNSLQAPSAIKEINGKPTVEFLTAFAATNSFGMIEPHADWNMLMWHPSQDTRDEVNYFTGGATFYPGDNFGFRLENGTTYSYKWVALYEHLYDTGPLTTGGDFYNYFVLDKVPAPLRMQNDEASGNNATDPASNEEASGDSATDPRPASCDGSWFDKTNGAYPSNPDVVQCGFTNGSGEVTGYFFKAFSTGVLSIPAFEQHTQAAVNFSAAVQKFIDGASEAGLTRIVIDLHRNDGGMVGLAFDTFGRFFPDVEPFAGSRRRSHPLGHDLGSALTERWEGPDRDLQEDWGELERDDEWVITPRLNADTGLNFKSWSEYHGPRTYRGDQFSLTERYNLFDGDFVDDAFHFKPVGYANKATGTAKWKAKDIVILTDGICSSACSMFVEFMTRQGVRTVVAGGRPEPGPMQASGSRGVSIYTTGNLEYDLRVAAGSVLSDTAYATLRDKGIITAWMGINLLDQVRAEEKKEEEPIPLQFRYEAADCRIYYTLQNLYNMTQLWLDVAAATWDDPSRCVKGSRGFSTTLGQEEKSNPPPPSPSAPPCLTADCTGISQAQPQDWNAEAAATVQDDHVIKGGPSSEPEAMIDMTRPCDYNSCPNRTCRLCNLTCPPHGPPSGPSQKRSVCVPKVKYETQCYLRNDYTRYLLKAVPAESGETKYSSNYMQWEWNVYNQYFCVPTRGDRNACPRISGSFV